MQITQAVAVEHNETQIHSLRFRFDEQPDDVGDFARRKPLTVGPVEFGSRSGAAPMDTCQLPARRHSVTMPTVLEAVGRSGEAVSLPEIILAVCKTDAGEMVYTTEGRSEPWEVSITSGPQKTRLMMYCRFSYAGLNVSDALNNVNFREALLGGASSAS